MAPEIAAEIAAEIKRQWQADHADVVAWVRRRSTGDRPFGFAIELAEKLQQYGTLTDGAVAAVRRMIAGDAQRDAARAAERAQAAVKAPVVSLDKLVEAFATARANYRKAPILRLAGFKFKEAKATSKNPGAIYVTEGDEYRGKITPEGRFHGFKCEAVTEAEIVRACADPKEAAIAYGRRTGSCAICGAELTNGVSIERGIGPICAEKWGW